MSDREHEQWPDDAQLGALLRAAGPRTQPTAAQLARWRDHFEAELPFIRVRRRRRVIALAVAATLALAVGLSWLPGAERESAPLRAPVAEVVTAFGGVVIRKPDGVVALQPGNGIVAGAQVASGLRSGLGAVYRGADLRLDAQTTVVFRDDHLELLRGRVYLDTGEPTRAPAKAVRVRTRRGEFSHLGTQFVVGVHGEEVIGAVREGRILLASGTGQVVLQAQPGRARMVVVDAGGDARLSDVAASGMLWSWAMQSSAGLVLSGRSADEVLRWVAREQGLDLEYLDAATRRTVVEATLSGGAEPVGPVQALQLVVTALGLQAHEAQGRLEVGAAVRR